MEGDVQSSRRSTFYLKYYLRIDLSWECTKFSVNSLLSYQILNVQISYLRLGTLKVLIA
ncbi:hypothetical protein HS141_15125 [Cetobacterium somerae]|nr:hypothetical protein [Cetobacterium somerae]